MENLLTYCELRLTYLQFGSGKEILLAFHGFGRNAEDFKIFEKTLGDRYTVLAFNLFHHGNTFYPSERIDKDTLEKKEIKALFDQLFTEKGIDKFSVLGYSLGGKVALTLIEQFPERVNNCYLMAPDGIKVTYWYKFVSHTWFGTRLYKGIMKKPKPFFAFINFLRGIRLMRKKIHYFIVVHMDTPEKRGLVYNVWMTFRKIEPKTSTVAQYINEQNIRVELFFGKYDKVIPPKIGQRFMRKLNQKDGLHVLESGHMLLNSDTDQLLKKLINHD